MAVPGGRNYAASAQVTYGIYVLNGSWIRVGGNSVVMYGSGYTTGGNKSLYGYDQMTFNYAGPFTDVRVVLESTDDGSNGALTGVSNMTWTSQTVSGQRSATPSGEKVISTMRPS